MTEEEKAEEYAEKHSFRVPYDGSNKFYDDVDYKASKDGFLAGLKAGRPQWHDLEKDPTDLPKEEREYIVMNANEGGDTSYWICYYWKEEKKFTGYGLGEVNVIKWKEIE